MTTLDFVVKRLMDQLMPTIKEDGNAGGDPRSHDQAEFPSGWQMPRAK